MRKNKIFIACDSNNIRKVKEIINEYESNIHKNESLNKIRSDLELILIKKASQS